MDEVKNLTTILAILDNYWKKISSDMTEYQVSQLKQELSGLETKMKSTKNIDEINDVAKEFSQVFSKLEPLDFLADIEKNLMRGGTLPELEEEIRIKIINYCVMLQDKISDLDEAQPQPPTINQ